MKSKNRYIIVVFLFIGSLIKAQNEQTLNMATYLWQANLTNPAIEPKGKKIVVSLPSVFGSVTTPVSLGQFIVTRNEKRILDPWSTQWIDKLKDFNAFEINAQLLTGAISVPIGKHFRVTGSHQTTSNSSFESTKDAASLLYKGNAQFIGKTANLYNLVSSSTRSEFGLGVSYETDNFTVAWRFKTQNGLVGAFTSANQLNLTTDVDHYGLSLETNYRLQTFEPSKTFKKLLLGNKGYSYDLGFRLKVDNYELTGAVLDILSKVYWNSNGTTYSSQGQADFFGFKKLDISKTTYESLTDTIQKALNIRDETGGVYRQELSPRIYAGLNYILADNLRMGVNFFLEGKPYGASYGAMVSATTKLWDFWDIGLSAGSRSGTSKMEFGLHGGMTLFNRAQLYLVTDNVIPYFSPTNAKSVNGRIGINVMFGKDEDDKTTTAKEAKKTKKKKKGFKLKIKKYWYKKKK
jgi:Family of unknown function (DUF5723)